MVLPYPLLPTPRPRAAAPCRLQMDPGRSSAFLTRCTCCPSPPMLHVRGAPRLRFAHGLAGSIPVGAYTPAGGLRPTCTRARRDATVRSGASAPRDAQYAALPRRCARPWTPLGTSARLKAASCLRPQPLAPRGTTSRGDMHPSHTIYSSIPTVTAHSPRSSSRRSCSPRRAFRTWTADRECRA